MGIIDRYHRLLYGIPEYIGDWICIAVYLLFQVAMVGGVLSVINGSTLGAVGFGALGALVVGFVYSG